MFDLGTAAWLRRFSGGAGRTASPCRHERTPTQARQGCSRWPTPTVPTDTKTTCYGYTQAQVWTGLHLRSTHRGPWLDHDGELRLVEGGAIHLQVEHLPSQRDPQLVWLWSSVTDASAELADLLWQVFLRRSAIAAHAANGMRPSADSLAMSIGSIDGVYLSGWEYNRILGPSPLTPRISALPSEILWNGAAHLWLFREVWCAKESLANEMAADEIMGWRTGRIFAELANEGVLRPLDWAADLSEPTRKLLLNNHEELRKRYHQGDDVRAAIKDRDMRALENMKIQLLEPVARSRGLIVGITPNSITLPEWKKEDRDDAATSQVEVHRFLAEVSAPLTGQLVAPSGLTLCERPGTGVAKSNVDRQNEVARTYEEPMISELLAGEGRYAGAEGYVPYLEDLTPHRSAYEPINTQLYTNWHANRDKLFRLRSAAEKYLWPNLHGEWLPELLADPSSAPRIARLVDRAIMRSEIGGLLTMRTDFVLGMTSVSIPIVVGRMLTEMADATARALITATAGVAVYTAVKAGLERRRDTRAEKNLALFYQQARKNLAY